MKRIFTILLVIFAMLMTSCEYLDKYLGDFMDNSVPDEFDWVHAVLPNTEEITKIELTEDYPAEVTDMAKCRGCALCAMMCPDVAIKVEKEV